MASMATLFGHAAKTEFYNGSFTFPMGGGDHYPVCYTYDGSIFEWAATAGNANVPLAKNEVFRVCIVRDKRVTAVKYDTEPAVTIDAAGQLVLGENALGAKWMTLRWSPVGEPAPVTADYITVGDVLGVPANKISSTSAVTNYGFDVFTTGDVEGSGGSVYIYLVAMDTRDGTGMCEGEPKHVNSYAMALCYAEEPKETDLKPEEKIPVSINDASPYSWRIGEYGDYDVIVFWPGTELAWQPAAPIKSLVVTQNGAQVTLTGDELAAYLKPSVNSLMQGVEDGKSVLNLAVTAPDVQYYTLYTKAKLSDTEWTKFEDYAKTLDNVDGKYYTRFRIDGESPLKIPVLTGETSRFYQLRGE